jgi:hypothetical protein
VADHAKSSVVNNPSRCPNLQATWLGVGVCIDDARQWSGGIPSL